MIGAGVSNRVVAMLDDGLLSFLDEEAEQTGLGRSHVLRSALRLLRTQKRREKELADLEVGRG